MVARHVIIDRGIGIPTRLSKIQNKQVIQYKRVIDIIPFNEARVFCTVEGLTGDDG